MQEQESVQSSTENVWEVVAQRDSLPQPAPLQRGFSIWSVLKSAIGKDLTRITLPATINEPLSALQVRSASINDKLCIALKLSLQLLAEPSSASMQ